MATVKALGEAFSAFLAFGIVASLIGPFSFEAGMSEPYLKIWVNNFIGVDEVDLTFKVSDVFRVLILRICLGCNTSSGYIFIITFQILAFVFIETVVVKQLYLWFEVGTHRNGIFVVVESETLQLNCPIDPPLVDKHVFVPNHDLNRLHKLRVAEDEGFLIDRATIFFKDPVFSNTQKDTSNIKWFLEIPVSQELLQLDVWINCSRNNWDVFYRNEDAVLIECNVEPGELITSILIIVFFPDLPPRHAVHSIGLDKLMVFFSVVAEHDSLDFHASPVD